MPTTTTAARPAPWAVGQRPAVRVTDTGLSDDLRLLAAHHGTVSDAIRAAVRQAAADLRQPSDSPAPTVTASVAPTDPDTATWPTHLAIRYDHHLHYDLRWLTSAGLSDTQQAIRWALATAATAISTEYDRTNRMPTITPGG